jgi:hypothetical protein
VRIYAGEQLIVTSEASHAEVQPVAVEPGHEAIARYFWTSWCSAGPPSATVTLADEPQPVKLTIIAPKGPNEAGLLVPPCLDAPTTISTTGLGPQPAPEVRYADSVSLSVPPSVAAGSVLKYTATLHDVDRAALASACPAYIETLSSAATTERAAARYLLNCTRLPATGGSSATFAMQLPIPASLPPGSYRLTWAAADLSAQTMVTVT